VAFTRWDPLRDLLALHARLDRLPSAEPPGWTPPIDVYETAAEYVVTAEVPGLSRTQIDIRFDDGHLVVRGERPTADTPFEQFHRVERGHGTFSRAFAIPEPVDIDAITADLRDGVLTITVPKVPPTQPHRIAVT
jgi:HSP20 family protein